MGGPVLIEEVDIVLYCIPAGAGGSYFIYNLTLINMIQKWTAQIARVLID